jgi:hypothetical protein
MRLDSFHRHGFQRPRIQSLLQSWDAALSNPERRPAVDRHRQDCLLTEGDKGTRLEHSSGYRKPKHLREEGADPPTVIPISGVP